MPANYHSTGGFALDLAVADLDADGNLDFVAPSFDTFVSVVLGDGQGGFGGQSDYVASEQVEGVAVGDLDGNGTLDIVTVSALTSTVTFLPGFGDGTFGPPQAA